MGCTSSRGATKPDYPPVPVEKYPAGGTGLYSNQQKAATVNAINSNPYDEAPKPTAADYAQYPPPLAAEQIRAGQYPHETGYYPPATGQYPPVAGAYPQAVRRPRRRRGNAGRTVVNSVPVYLMLIILLTTNAANALSLAGH